MENLKSSYEGKTVLVTGGVGSIGREIVKSVLRFNPKAVRIFDNNESGLFDLELELKSEKIRPLIGNIEDTKRLLRAIEDVDIVFHAAALKHVPLCEYNPFEAVKTNIVGTQNLIDVSIDEEVEKFITISTDKAVNPVNVMGATKLLAERLTISANFYKGPRKSVFSSVRFGNVLDTRGSVIPLFRNQIKNGGPVTITDPDMTRFIMSIPKAVSLVLSAAQIAEGGELFILKMPVVRIGDLAEVITDKLSQRYGFKPGDIKMESIGKRHGEKIYEELMTEDEALNAYEDNKMFVVMPQQIGNLDEESSSLPERFKKTKKEVYSSKDENLLHRKEIYSLLDELDF